jgi:hypothetical protein
MTQKFFSSLPPLINYVDIRTAEERAAEPQVTMTTAGEPINDMLWLPPSALPKAFQPPEEQPQDVLFWLDRLEQCVNVSDFNGAMEAVRELRARVVAPVIVNTQIQMLPSTCAPQPEPAAPSAVFPSFFMRPANEVTP